MRRVFAACIALTMLGVPAFGAELRRAQPIFYLYDKDRSVHIDAKTGMQVPRFEAVVAKESLEQKLRPKTDDFVLCMAGVADRPDGLTYLYLCYADPAKKRAWYVIVAKIGGKSVGVVQKQKFESDVDSIKVLEGVLQGPQMKQVVGVRVPPLVAVPYDTSRVLDQLPVIDRYLDRKTHR